MVLVPEIATDCNDTGPATITVNEFVALNCGTPLSVTIVVIVFVAGDWPTVGVQEITPLVSIAAPAGELVNT